MFLSEAVVGVGMESAASASIFEILEHVTGAKQENEHTRLVLMSANTVLSLEKIKNEYLSDLKNTRENVGFLNKSCTSHLEKPLFEHRMAVVARDREDLIIRLENNNYDMGTVQACEAKKKIGFIFSGQGFQYLGMSKNLYDTFLNFQSALNQVNDLFQVHLGKSIKTLMWEDEALLGQSWYAQAAIFSVQYALTKLWSCYGIEPDIITGFSFGEIGAVVACGLISLEDGVEFVAKRGDLVRKLPPGRMIQIWATHDVINEIVQDLKEAAEENEFWIDLTSITPEYAGSVYGGRPSNIELMHQACEEKGISSVIIPATHAFHTRAMDCVMDELEGLVSNLTYRPPKCDYISMTRGRKAELEDFCPKYWCNQMRNPVRFSDSIDCLWSFGCRVLIEIGPQPSLLKYALRNLRELASQVTTCASIGPTEENWATFLNSVGKVYVNV